MTDISIMKSADSETIKQRVKAIYPHIVVSGDIDKPYYSIHWYDIEKEEMYCGFSSYKLELVHKWLQEEFEVVEADIDNLINRQKAKIESKEKELEAFAKWNKEYQDEIYELRKSLLSKENLEESFSKAVKQFDKKLARTVKLERAEAVKEFAELLKSRAVQKYWQDGEIRELDTPFVLVGYIDSLLEEKVGEENA